MSVSTIAEVSSDWRTGSELANQWWSLVEESAHPSLTRSPSWLRQWQRHFGDLEQCEPIVITVRERGQLIGVVPLLRRVRLRNGLVPTRVIEFLGTGEATHYEILSEFVGPLALPGSEHTVAQAAALLIEQGGAGRFDEIHLTSMDSDCLATAALLVALTARGYQGSIDTELPCHWVPLPDSLDQYFGLLEGGRRQRLRRILRKFEKWAPNAEFHRAQSTAEALAELGALSSLHTQRWQTDGDPGAFGSPLFESFHSNLLAELFDRGVIELSWLACGGARVAASLNFVVGGVVHFYQCGRLPSVPANISPGVVMHIRSIESCISRGFREYHFLAGDSRYKRTLSLADKRLFSWRYRKPTARATISDVLTAGRSLLLKYKGSVALHPQNEPKHRQGSKGGADA